MNGIVELFFVFFKIGLLSIGGGYAIIPLIQEQVVNQNSWISQQMFTDIITISQMTPGPLAVNTSTFVGIQIAGIGGAAAATAGCVISGIIISVLLYRFFSKNRESVYVLEVLNGLKAASLGLILSAAAVILLLTFFGTQDYNQLKQPDAAAVVMCGLSLLVLRKWKWNPILIMVLAGAAGIILYR